MADRFVVDTSVFLRWYVPQIGFEHAREVRQDFLTGAVALETVDSTRFELGQVLRTTGLLKGRLTAGQYRAAVRSRSVPGRSVTASVWRSLSCGR